MDEALTPPEVPTDLGDGMRRLGPSIGMHFVLPGEDAHSRYSKGDQPGRIRLSSRPMGRATAIDRRSLCQTAVAAESGPRPHASWRLWAWMSVTTGDPTNCVLISTGMWSLKTCRRRARCHRPGFERSVRSTTRCPVA